MGGGDFKKLLTKVTFHWPQHFIMHTNLKFVFSSMAGAFGKLLSQEESYAESSPKWNGFVRINLMSKIIESHNS